MNRIHTFALSCLLILMTVIGQSVMAQNSASAFFEAGQRDYWPLTVEGYSAQFVGSSIRFAPAFYTLGQAISPQITVTNPHNNGEKTQTIYLYVSKVIESPKGRTIEDGTPNGPDIGDGELNLNEQSGDDLQSMPTIYTVGTFTFAPGSTQTISYSFTPGSTGYYQFDFSTLPPGNGYVQGHILAAGFIRVLTGGAQSSPMATPMSSPSPTPNMSPIPTNTPSPTPSASPVSDPQSGRRTGLSNDSLDCSNRSFDAVMDVKEDGNARKDIKVTFRFNGSTKETRTNDNGRARAEFDQNGNGSLTADAEDYPSQSMYITIPQCDNVNTNQNPDNGVGGGSFSDNGSTGSVNGTTITASRGSRVLGADTLANTGMSTTYLLSLISLAGLGLTGSSFYAYYKTKN